MNKLLSWLKADPRIWPYRTNLSFMLTFITAPVVMSIGVALIDKRLGLFVFAFSVVLVMFIKIFLRSPPQPQPEPAKIILIERDDEDERVSQATDSFIVAVSAVAQLAILPRVWQALPFGSNFAITTRSKGWDAQRVLPGPPDEDEECE